MTSGQRRERETPYLLSKAETLRERDEWSGTPNTGVTGSANSNVTCSRRRGNVDLHHDGAAQGGNMVAHADFAAVNLNVKSIAFKID